MRIRRRRDDILFSEYLRRKRDYTCERCLRNFTHEKGRLDVSHYFGRKNETLRFDEENVRVLCKGCHRLFHESPNEHREFMLKTLGENGLNMLVLRSQKFTKRNVESNCAMIRLRIEYLDTHM
jgi:5-methylcytosine-specific restriction endonuclease McrA